MSFKKQAEEIFNRHLSEYDIESYTEADEDIKQCHLNAIIEALNKCPVNCTKCLTQKLKSEYRVIAFKDGEDTFYQIHRVYFNKHGKPTSYTENGVTIGGHSKLELIEELGEFKWAILKPYIPIEEFE